MASKQLKQLPVSCLESVLDGVANFAGQDLSPKHVDAIIKLLHSNPSVSVSDRLQLLYLSPLSQPQAQAHSKFFLYLYLSPPPVLSRSVCVCVCVCVYLSLRLFLFRASLIQPESQTNATTYVVRIA